MHFEECCALTILSLHDLLILVASEKSFIQSNFFLAAADSAGGELMELGSISYSFLRPLFTEKRNKLCRLNN